MFRASLCTKQCQDRCLLLIGLPGLNVEEDDRGAVTPAAETSPAAERGATVRLPAATPDSGGATGERRHLPRPRRALDRNDRDSRIGGIPLRRRGFLAVSYPAAPMDVSDERQDIRYRQAGRLTNTVRDHGRCSAAFFGRSVWILRGFPAARSFRTSISARAKQCQDRCAASERDVLLLIRLPGRCGQVLSLHAPRMTPAAQAPYPVCILKSDLTASSL